MAVSQRRSASVNGCGAKLYSSLRSADVLDELKLPVSLWLLLKLDEELEMDDFAALLLAPVVSLAVNSLRVDRVLQGQLVYLSYGH
jgi:hypothetical protein